MPEAVEDHPRGYKFESHSLAPQCPALAGLQI